MSAHRIFWNAVLIESLMVLLTVPIAWPQTPAPDPVLATSVIETALKYPPTRTCSSTANGPMSADLRQVASTLLTNSSFIRDNPVAAGVMLATVSGGWPDVGERIFQSQHDAFMQAHEKIRTGAERLIPKVKAASTEGGKDMVRLSYLSSEHVDGAVLLSGIRLLKREMRSLLDDVAQGRTSFDQFEPCAIAMGPGGTLATRLYPDFGGEHSLKLRTILNRHTGPAQPLELRLQLMSGHCSVCN